MKFQTREEVKQAAEESDESALLCSIEHYNQMLAASEKELREAKESKITGIGSLFCGLCMRNLFKVKYKGHCLMKIDCKTNCFTEWKFLNNLEDGKTPWPEVRAAMGEVRRVLQEKYDELYPRKDQIEADKKKEFEPIIIEGLGVSVEMHDSTLPFPIRIGVGFPDDVKSGVWSVNIIKQFIKALQSTIDHVEANK